MYMLRFLFLLVCASSSFGFAIHNTSGQKSYSLAHSKTKETPSSPAALPEL